MNNLTAEEYLRVMMDLVRDGGVIARDLISSSDPRLKADASVVTEADYRISALAAKRLEPFLNSGRHVLVDEEDPRCAAFLNESFLNEHPFVWSIDPIDATRAYSNGIPYYGISLGLLKDRKPWLGVVYFPSLNELFFCDGNEAYYVQHPFSGDEVRKKIEPRDDHLTSRSLFIATDEIMDSFSWSKKDCRVVVLAAAVCEFCWPSIGRASGSVSRVHLWDLAGSWPIFQRAGLQLRSLATGEVLDQLKVSAFEAEKTPWRLKDYYILSSEKNYPLFKERLLCR